MAHTQPLWMGSTLLCLCQTVSPASLASPYVGAVPTLSLASTGNLGPHVHLLHSYLYLGCGGIITLEPELIISAMLGCLQLFSTQDNRTGKVSVCENPFG